MFENWRIESWSCLIFSIFFGVGNVLIGVIDKTLTLTHKVPIGNETVTMYGGAALTSSCSGSGSGGGRVCKASGKVELGHYCRLDVPRGPVGTGVYGCYAVDGSA